MSRCYVGEFVVMRFVICMSKKFRKLFFFQKNIRAFACASSMLHFISRRKLCLVTKVYRTLLSFYRLTSSRDKSIKTGKSRFAHLYTLLGNASFASINSALSAVSKRINQSSFSISAKPMNVRSTSTT